MYFRHEKDAHGVLVETTSSASNERSESTKVEDDFLYNYHRAKLTFGLVLFEFNDAIKEGDGQRLFELYKLALLLYKVNEKTKYSYVILRYLVQISALLSDKDAHNLKWNRFFQQTWKKRK